MNNLVEKYDSLRNFLNFPNLPLGKDAVVSGSFAWHVLTENQNAGWYPNDMDVYCTASSVTRLRECLNDNGYKLNYLKILIDYKETDCIVEQWASPENRPYEHESYDQLVDYFNLRNTKYKIPKYTFPPKFGIAEKENGVRYVQLVISSDPKQQDPTVMIRNGFDFSSLENWFDGESFHIHDEELVRNKSSHIVIRFHYKEYYEKVLKRHLKYTVYGMNFLDNIDELLYKDILASEDVPEKSLDVRTYKISITPPLQENEKVE
jgi:hypothetical protein